MWHAALPDGTWQTCPQACGTASRCRHRWPSFAAYIMWICGSSTGEELMWRSGGGVLHSSHAVQWISIVGRCNSCRARPLPSLPRHMPSPTHFPELGSRLSAGFFAPLAGVVGRARSGRFVGCGSSFFACGVWRFRCGARNGRCQGCTRACELVRCTPRVPVRVFRSAFVDRVG
jgi:hypothetical protein